MSREQDNKAIVGRWFEGFWGNPWDPPLRAAGQRRLQD